MLSMLTNFMSIEVAILHWHAVHVLFGDSRDHDHNRMLTSIIRTVGRFSSPRLGYQPPAIAAKTSYAGCSYDCTYD